MNVAIVLAGGMGTRMRTNAIPKQFLELNGKPIIIHTLEIFEKTEEIDAICVSCIESHLSYMQELCDRYRITKVKWIVPGGNTRQESIFVGLKILWENCDHNNTVVIIHDGVRPNITSELIQKNIECVLKEGNAISCSRATETPAEIGENNLIAQILDRKIAIVAKTPQSFWLFDIYHVHQKAEQDQLEDFIDSSHLMHHYGYALHMVECAWDNIKITNPSDFYILRAILEMKENYKIIGI